MLTRSCVVIAVSWRSLRVPCPGSFPRPVSNVLRRSADDDEDNDPYHYPYSISAAIPEAQRQALRWTFEDIDMEGACALTIEVEGRCFGVTKI